MISKRQKNRKEFEELNKILMDVFARVRVSRFYADDIFALHERCYHIQSELIDKIPLPEDTIG